MVPQYCILNALICSSLWQGVDRLGHAGPTVEQQLFSVDASMVLIHQGLSFFSTNQSNNWDWCHQTGGSFRRLYLFCFSAGFHASPLIFCLLFFVLSLLSFFFFLLSVSPSGYIPCLIFPVVPIAFVKLIGLKNQCYEQMDC